MYYVEKPENMMVYIYIILYFTELNFPLVKRKNISPSKCTGCSEKIYTIEYNTGTAGEILPFV